VTSAGRLATALAALALAACAGDPPDANLLDVSSPLGFSTRPLADFAPADDPLSEAVARLGRQLFFDPRLSRTGTVSCASCHDPAHAFADPRPVSQGVDGQRGTRNAPALVNLAWSESFFWDGRAATLEEQVGMPIANPIEMDSFVADAVARLGAVPAYARAFVDAFGTAPSETTLRRALASFVRTLVSGGSAYDRFLAGDATALSAGAARGRDIFLGERAGCFHCHPTGSLTNQGFFNNGSYVAGGDRGRQAITGRTGDLGKFKVPGLRNVAASAPYMHDGTLPTLEAVIDQYDRGGRGDPSTDPQIIPLHLAAAEKADLLAFLRALTDEEFLRDPRYRGSPP
jgi:cytochrome c peroxidase